VDKLIDYRYTSQEIPLKWENKRELLNQFKIQYNEDTPLIGVISRLVAQKGFDLIEEIIPELMKEDVKMIILGQGDEKYQKHLKTIEKKYKDKLAIVIGFDEVLAHKIEAGADMFLMPSKYEPCGLNQMYSLRYGTVPVVRNTGGLADTIVDYKKPNGNGFLFNKYSSKEFIEVIKTAVKLYQDKDKWNKILRNGMSLDFSWKVSAKKYTTLYKSLV